MEWLVEKLTEIGVDRIVPILCEHSERKVLKLDRLYKIAISAMKQSGQVFLPHIEPLTPFIQVVEKHSNGFIAHCESDNEKHQWAKQNLANDLTLLIGPEGDFSPKEVNLAHLNGYNTISLGNSILRTETAAIYAATIANAQFN
jgi:16S rRNA (uracil1498-N3)-methyltransferase